MKKIIELQRKVVPEVLDLTEKRYSILKEISNSKFIGRRSLSSKLNYSERVVRNEIEFLKNEGFISVNSVGMETTQKGNEIVDGLGEYLSEVKGLSNLGNTLRDILSIKNVIVVPSYAGDEDNSLRDIGKESAKYFLKTLRGDWIVGVTGGYTLHHFSEQMPKGDYPKLYIVPARGGVGEVSEIQSNTIVANLASKLGAKYKLLQIPDNIDKDFAEYIHNNPLIQSTYEYISKIDILVFGIGNAEVMSKRRNSSSKILSELKRLGAVAESFGHYFDINGNNVMETGTVGIKLEQYKNMEHIIGVAGGSSKADAILSISKINRNLVLIIDESVAYTLKDKLL